MKLIVAVNNLGYIGKDNQLMWKCKEDMKHFRKMTSGNVVIMGRKTFNSMNNIPLKNRVNIIVGKEYLPLDIAIISAKMIADKNGCDVYIIGGSAIYNQTVHMCDEIHMSYIGDDSIGDVKFEVGEEYKGKIIKYNFKKDE